MAPFEFLVRSRSALALALTTFAAPALARQVAPSQPPPDPGSPQALGPGDAGTVVDNLPLNDALFPFEKTLGDHDEFGGAVAGLGDLNGDGLVEFAIGAPGDRQNRGAVWIFSLAADRRVVKHVKLGPAENLPFVIDPGDRFGSAVAALGDLDGDGIGDLAVGAPGDDDGLEPPFSNGGAVYVLFLRGSGLVREHLKLGLTSGFPGTLHAGDAFGSAVAQLGDLDGDGIPDLTVGAPGDNDGAIDAGATWILFFRADRTVRSVTKISQTSGGFGGTLAHGDRMGSALARLGDLSGDGTPELAAGAPGTDGTRIDSGGVWVLSLARDGSVAAETLVTGLPDLDQGDLLGTSVAGLGDLDGDGVGDLAAGAPATAISDMGFYVVLLQSDGSVKASRRTPMTVSSFDSFGTALAAPGDSNGDGRQDVVVGVPLFDTRLENSGAILFYELNPDGSAAGAPYTIDAVSSGLPLAPRFFESGGNPDDRYGAAVAPLGDLNGDGLPEVAVGAPQDDDGGTNRGAVWIHFLTTTGGTRVTKLSATQGGLPLLTNHRFGEGLASLDDLDGNGRNELVVAGGGAGDVWVLFLQSNGDAAARVQTPGIGGGPRFQTALTSLGDLDGDGNADLAVAILGRIWVYFMNADGTRRSFVELDKSLIPLASGDAGYGQSMAYLGSAAASGARYLAVGGSSHLWRIELDPAGGIAGAVQRSFTDPRALASPGDLDGNGVGDLALLHRGFREIRIDLLRADWSVQQTLRLGSGKGPFALASLGDLSGDGVNDVAVASLYGAGTRANLLQLGGLVSWGFEHQDTVDQRPLENGRQIPSPHPGRTFTISSAGANLGATAFDSTPGGPNDPSQDLDLLVDSGTVLILQDSLTGTQSVPGIFDFPNDDRDGGSFRFDFPRLVRPLSLELVDIDLAAGQDALVTLADDAGRTRVYDVPAGWTEDIHVEGGAGLRKLDLTTLAPQPGFRATATAAETSGFAAARVVWIEVVLGSSGAVDDLTYDPYP